MLVELHSAVVPYFHSYFLCVFRFLVLLLSLAGGSGQWAAIVCFVVLLFCCFFVSFFWSRAPNPPDSQKNGVEKKNGERKQKPARTSP